STIGFRLFGGRLPTLLIYLSRPLRGRQVLFGPPQATCGSFCISPSPLAGEGGGGKKPQAPHPHPPPPGGREPEPRTASGPRRQGGQRRAERRCSSIGNRRTSLSLLSKQRKSSVSGGAPSTPMICTCMCPFSSRSLISLRLRLCR